MAKKSIIVEPFPLVCCLPTHADVMPEQGILRKLTRRFYHKSGSELRLEEAQRVKLLPTLKNY